MSEKDVLCFQPAGTGLVLCIRHLEHRTSFLSRQREVMASFSCGACTEIVGILVKYFELGYFWYLNRYYTDYISLCLLLAKRGDLAAMVASCLFHYCDRSFGILCEVIANHGLGLKKHQISPLPLRSKLDCKVLFFILNI